MGKKSPVTPPGIDPETVQLVPQCLNHHATPGPIEEGFTIEIFLSKVFIVLKRALHTINTFDKKISMLYVSRKRQHKQFHSSLLHQ
jgi:hypothetical protein